MVELFFVYWLHSSLEAKRLEYYVSRLNIKQLLLQEILQSSLWASGRHDVRLRRDFLLFRTPIICG